jgi:hypothetical protein
VRRIAPDPHASRVGRPPDQRGRLLGGPLRDDDDVRRRHGHRMTHRVVDQLDARDRLHADVVELSGDDR